MTRSVRVSPEVRQDLQRLADFLVERNTEAANRAAAAIASAIVSLGDFAVRGASAKRPGWRELQVRFGRNAYIIRYRVEEDAVFVARVFHSRERR